KTVEYLDARRLAIQSQTVRGTGRDVIASTYDAMGRKVDDLMPYPTSATPGFRTSAATETTSHYASEYGGSVVPKSSYTYDKSGLSHLSLNPSKTSSRTFTMGIPFVHQSGGELVEVSASEEDLPAVVALD